MIDVFLSSTLTLLSPEILFMMIVVCVIGLIFGALPGLNATMAVAILLPITVVFEKEIGLALLIGAYISGVSGGMVSATLLRIPGTPSSIATTFDAYPLAQKGQAIKALATGFIASFTGGMLSLAVLVFFAPQIAAIAISFSPFEYSLLSLLALIAVGLLSSDNLIKGLAALFIGINLSLIGFAPIDGTQRFNGGSPDLAAGISLLPFMIGLFAIPQLMREAFKATGTAPLDLKIGGIGVTFREIKENITNIIRSSMIGVGIGVLPGIGGAASNLIAYTTAKLRSKDPSAYGKGHVGGIWASESANNASIGGALLPLLALGIPGDGVTAMLIGGFEIHGLQPGPMLFESDPSVIYSIYAAFFITCILVLAIQLSTVKYIPRILLIPRHYLVPMLLVLTAIGAYVADFRFFDLWVMLAIGILGYILEKYKFPLAPVVLGFVMAPLFEENSRRALILSDGDFMPFLTRPYSISILTMIAILLTIITIKQIQKTRTTGP